MFNKFVRYTHFSNVVSIASVSHFKYQAFISSYGINHSSIWQQLKLIMMTSYTCPNVRCSCSILQMLWFLFSKKIYLEVFQCSFFLWSFFNSGGFLLFNIIESLLILMVISLGMPPVHLFLEILQVFNLNYAFQPLSSSFSSWDLDDSSTYFSCILVPTN